ncbi:hypothetical protein IQ266_18825 [filamentous cyanobacterium LEGE 11480]|uniref:Uncharacterized protein n=1 Tax=Romeriopsis navalis LEGE 11480 TaxID=2777977 RepID=A0A928VSM0_9CYAN|nr:hypothetical protein [Romeriopsis navalis]MBE9031792.1 hypothetical protein [Romeriopsis navalis LEGE 11480]
MTTNSANQFSNWALQVEPDDLNPPDRMMLISLIACMQSLRLYNIAATPGEILEVLPFEPTDRVEAAFLASQHLEAPTVTRAISLLIGGCDVND